MSKSDIKHEITERIAILSEHGNGWTKELNKVSWNGRTAKYDLRDWHHEDDKIGKGITLTEDEIRNLKEVLNAIEL
ncbi:PC4/YdbC family ssDNA-binding protein (plasmid) [Fusobacteria bacterium ZRK30]|nr:PC4/YdbC family ssDNA-binding protein [Fusobacteria bacterium ZRK30]